jgi:hypothetical protein
VRENSTLSRCILELELEIIAGSDSLDLFADKFGDDLRDGQGGMRPLVSAVASMPRRECLGAFVATTLLDWLESPEPFNWLQSPEPFYWLGSPGPSEPSNF